MVDFKKEIEWGLTRKSGSITTPPLVLDMIENSRAAFPLRLRQASSYIKDRIALIG